MDLRMYSPISPNTGLEDIVGFADIKIYNTPISSYFITIILLTKEVKILEMNLI